MNAGKVAEHGGASASGHGLFCHRVSDPIEQMDKAFLIVFGQVLEQLGDPVDANPQRLVFNRIVSLRDSWAKREGRGSV